MRHAILCIALAGLALAAPAAPRIASDAFEFDAGARRIGTKVEHTFTIRNTGDEPLRIHELKPGCGCTTANLEKSELLPGESTAIRATLDLTSRRGPQVKHITVKSNDPASPDFQLVLKVNSLDDFVLDPAYIDLGQITAGVAVSRQATLRVTSEKPWKVTELVPVKNLVKATVESSPDGKLHTLTVAVPPQTAAGAFYDNVQIRTDNPDSQVLALQVVGTVMEGLQVAPSPVPLEPNPGPVSRTITVRGGSIKTFRITAAAYPDPAVTVEVGTPTVFGQQVKLRFPSVDAAQDGKELVITTDVKGLETLRVPVRVGPPAAPATP